MAKKIQLKSKRRLWYLRTSEGVKGPFPSKQLRQYLVIGRLKISDQVSEDGELWETIADIADLLPKIVPTDNEELEKQQLFLAKRNAEERTGLDRRDLEPEDLVPDSRRSGADRRAKMKSSRRYSFFKSIYAGGSEERRSLHLLLFIFFPLLVFAGWLWYQKSPGVPLRDCNMATGPGINWNTCVKTHLRAEDADLRGAIMSSMSLVGAQLKRANLQNSNLSYSRMTGSKLSNADLSNAKLVGAELEYSYLLNTNFNNADLSYANLQNATISGADFTNAKLDHTIWIDGRVCAIGSIGECL